MNIFGFKFHGQLAVTFSIIMQSMSVKTANSKPALIRIILAIDMIVFLLPNLLAGEMFVASRFLDRRGVGDVPSIAFIDRKSGNFSSIL